MMADPLPETRSRPDIHSAATTQPTEELLLGRYRLSACLGEGAMARVYLAEDVVLGREVAIKLMRGPAEASVPKIRARSEMTLLASVTHPSLVTLFDAHIGDRQDFLVMEYVSGSTLSERLASGPLEPAVVAALAADLAEALHTVHAAGIVHRDVKPSNVLLADNPVPGRGFRAKLADFGIAYLLDTARVTSPGTVVGTAAYLAPEQVRGAPPAPPADIYSLGLVLLEALTGERAWPHSTGMEAVVVRLSTPPHIPHTIDSRWARLIREMTDADPGARPTALEVALAASRLDESVPPASPVTNTPTVPIPVVPAAMLPGAVIPGDTAPDNSGRDIAAPGTQAPETAGPTRSATRREARTQQRRRMRTAAVWSAALLGAMLVGGPASIIALHSVGTATSAKPGLTVVTERDTSATDAAEQSTPPEDVSEPVTVVVPDTPVEQVPVDQPQEGNGNGNSGSDSSENSGNGNGNANGQGNGNGNSGNGNSGNGNSGKGDSGDGDG